MPKHPRSSVPVAVALARACLVLAGLALAGCATTYPMMPTPVIYTGAAARPVITELPAGARTPPLDLLYLTDRAQAKPGEGDEPYSADRSRSLAFGSTTVQFGEGLTWEMLLRQSQVAERTVKVELTLGPTKELGRYPAIPYPTTPAPGGLMRTPAAVDAHEATTKALHEELARRLAASPRKEVVLYVHGYHNTFRDAALTMGELCHFLGREHVCAIFTWPAGGTRGLLFGYNVDYESSVFATEHLRKAIRTIAATPGLQRVHLLAHSRGTDVLASALSELAVEAYTQQTTLPRYVKAGNVVLMAPDIDADVAPTKIFKLISDPDLPYGTARSPRLVVPPSPGFHLTLYVSPDDKALAASSLLFGSVARLGRLRAEMLPPEQIEQFRRLRFFDVIQFVGKADLFGHSYFVANPHVSADLVSLLRYGLRPNEPGRPLEAIDPPFWRVPTGGGN